MAAADRADVRTTAGALPPLLREPRPEVSLAPNLPRPELGDQTRRDLEAALARPPTARESIARMDLARHMRLAVISAPVVTTNRFGDSTSNIPVLRLEW